MTMQLSASAVAARLNRAAEMFQAGRTYEEIQLELGYTSRASVQQAIRKALRRQATSNGTIGALNLQFGAEIEIDGGVTAHQIARALTDAGIECYVEGYNHTTRPHWKVVPDGTVSVGEVVAPILYGEAGLQILERVMTVLTNIGAVVNRRCGLHIHHDMGQMTTAQIADVIDLYENNADVIDTLVAESRRRSRNMYTQRATARTRAEIRRNLMTYRRGVTRQLTSSRYLNVNPEAFIKYGTLEFRQHGGTTNGKKAIAWVRFTHALVQLVKNRGSVNASANINELLDRLVAESNLPAETAEYLKNRALELA